MQQALGRAENIPMKVSVARLSQQDWQTGKKSLSLKTDVPVCNREGVGKVGREGSGHALSWQLPQEDDGRKNTSVDKPGPYVLHHVLIVLC